MLGELVREKKNLLHFADLSYELCFDSSKHGKMAEKAWMLVESMESAKLLYRYFAQTIQAL